MAFTSSDHIDFSGFYTTSDNTRFVTHELGHAFDQKVCAAYQGGAACANILTGSIIRADLKRDVATMRFLDRNSYGDSENLSGTPAFSGFAGGRDVWQFTASGQVRFSDFPGEVWADMFLGWVYDNLATERKNYMNNVMPNYLSLFN